jgi:sugar phosphate isomerase/epimerase
MYNWKIACSTAQEAPETAPILLKGDICSNLIKAAELGYQAIEVHMRETTVLDLPAIRKTMKQTGVSICNIVTGRLNTEGKVNLIDDIPYINEAAMKGMKQYIEMAAALDADIIIGWVKGNVPPGAPRSKYLDRLADNLSILNSYAKVRNVRINLEVINRYEVNIFTTCAELVDFLNTHQLDQCYVHLDTFHMNIDETEPVEAIHLAGDRLGYFHLADNSRRYLGSGQLDFRKTLAALSDINYQGYLSVECLPYPTGEEAAFKSIAYLKSLLREQVRSNIIPNAG